MVPNANPSRSTRKSPKSARARLSRSTLNARVSLRLLLEESYKANCTAARGTSRTAEPRAPHAEQPQRAPLPPFAQSAARGGSRTPSRTPRSRDSPARSPRRSPAGTGRQARHGTPFPRLTWRSKPSRPWWCAPPSPAAAPPRYPCPPAPRTSALPSGRSLRTDPHGCRPPDRGRPRTAPSGRLGQWRGGAAPEHHGKRSPERRERSSGVSLSCFPLRDRADIFKDGTKKKKISGVGGLKRLREVQTQQSSRKQRKTNNSLSSVLLAEAQLRGSEHCALESWI